MQTRREFLLNGVSATAMTVALLQALVPSRAAAQPAVPAMPPRNPWLADSVYPTSHFNPGATNSVIFAGPVHGRSLAVDDVKTVPTVITSNPAIKKVGAETIAFASGAVGVLKLRLTGKALEADNFVAYPGFEADAGLATEAAIQAVLEKLDAAERARDETQIVAALATVGGMGKIIGTGINGVYNLFDKDGTPHVNQHLSAQTRRLARRRSAGRGQVCGKRRDGTAVQRAAAAHQSRTLYWAAEAAGPTPTAELLRDRVCSAQGTPGLAPEGHPCAILGSYVAQPPPPLTLAAPLR